MSFWGRYVPMAERRAKAMKKLEKLRKKGLDIQPVELEGRTIARSFWGKNWCKHIESFSDYSNRLPRGTRYVRNGSVCHLEINRGEIKAIVSGSELYHITIAIQPLKPALWEAIKRKCSGQIGSILELLQGRLSDQVMRVVTDGKEGLFPRAKEIDLDCDCPDWAQLCKHLAATLYGVGARLDAQPELLFLLRGVDAAELIDGDIALPDTGASASDEILADDTLADIFGVEIDLSDEPPPPVSKKRKKRAARKKMSRSRKPARSAASPPAPVENPTGESIARLRKSLGLSAAKFAQRLGVTTASVYRWEKIRGPVKLQSRPLQAWTELVKEVD